MFLLPLNDLLPRESKAEIGGFMMNAQRQEIPMDKLEITFE
jgi:hypothetical protein